MNKIRESIFTEICKERKYQDDKWGNVFDDKNTLNDWVAYMIQYLGQSSKLGVCKSDQRKQLLKAVSIGVAALETFDHNNGFAERHFEVSK